MTSGAEHSNSIGWSDDSTRTRRAVQAAGVGLWDWDLITNRTYFSPEWTRQLGYEPDELTPSFAEWRDRLHPDDRERAVCAAEAFRDGRQPRYEEEFRLRHRDGTYRWILAKAEVERNALGRDLRMLGSHVDITRRKQAELSLAESERELRVIADSLPGPVSHVGSDMRYRFVNARYLDAFGVSPIDAVGRLVREVVGEAMFERIEEYGLRALKGEHVTFEIDVPVLGSTRTLVNTFTPHIDETGAVIGFFVVGNDITERKQRELERERLERQLRQAAKMESVGRLAGGVAHDFNNMLGVILGHAELALENTASDHPLFADLQGIRDAATRSANITRQLLAFARQQSVSPEVLQLNDRVSGMLTLLPRLLGENIRVEAVTDPALWPVKVDASQVDQILTNLCVNARNAIPNVGSIHIETANCTVDEAFCQRLLNAVPGDYVRLRVRDTGVGMSDETLAHIFEPFFTTASAGEGTGLGLATVFGAVSQNGGFIEVESQPAHGSTFDIYLPRYVGRSPSGIDAANVGTSGPSSGTVLVVEDEAALLTITGKMLRSQGYFVLAAHGPEEALRLAKAHNGLINLLLTDVIMPGMNGRELSAILRSQRPELRCLFMSGYPADAIATHGVVDEELAFLQKPFRIAQLSAKVREVLSR